jgi:hypothetical protein
MDSVREYSCAVNTITISGVAERATANTAT